MHSIQAKLLIGVAAFVFCGSLIAVSIARQVSLNQESKTSRLVRFTGVVVSKGGDGYTLFEQNRRLAVSNILETPEVGSPILADLVDEMVTIIGYEAKVGQKLFIYPVKLEKMSDLGHPLKGSS